MPLLLQHTGFHKRDYLKSIVSLSEIEVCISSLPSGNLMNRANTRLTLTNSFHPQGDGQTERTDVVLRMFLRNFIAPDHRVVAIFGIGMADPGPEGMWESSTCNIRPYDAEAPPACSLTQYHRGV